MKKNYKQPIIETAQLMPGTMVLAGSPPVINNGGNTGDPGISGGGAPIGD